MYLRIVQKGRFLILLLLSLAIITSGCATRKHYRAYLLNPDISTSSPNDFKVAVENSVSVPKDSRIRIVLDDIKVGMLHSYPESKGLTGLPEYEGLGGKELWLVMDATTLENVDPLGLKSKRITAASNVKIDRESFTFLSLDDAERIPFDQLMNTSYRIEFKLYEVNGLELKKAIFQTAQKSIGLQTWNALETTFKSAGGFVAGEVAEIFKEQTKEPLFFEKVLLTTGAKMVFFGAFDLITTARSDQFGSKEFALFDIANSELNKPDDYLATAQEDVAVMTPRGRSAGQAIAAQRYDSRQSDRLVGEIDDINNHLDRLTNLIAGVTKDIGTMERALDQDYKSLTNINLYIKAISNKVDELSSVDSDMATKLTNVSYLLVRVNNSLEQLNIGDTNKKTVTEFEQASSALKAQLTQIADQLHSFTNGQAQLPRGRVKTPLQYYEAYQRFHSRRIELPTRDHFESGDFSKIDHDVLRDTFIRFRVTTPSLQEQLKSITLPAEEASKVDESFLNALRAKVNALDSPVVDYSELINQKRYIELVAFGVHNTITLTGAIQQYDSLKQWNDVIRLYQMFASYNEREAIYRVGPMAAKAYGVLGSLDKTKQVLAAIFKAVKENIGLSQGLILSPSQEEISYVIKELEAIKPFMPTSELTDDVALCIKELRALVKVEGK